MEGLRGGSKSTTETGLWIGMVGAASAVMEAFGVEDVQM